MDQANFLRVKLEFREKIKVAKLDSRVDTSLSSMTNLRKLIFKNFPEVGDVVEASGTSGPVMLMTVKCLDGVGDFVTLDNDKDLEVATEHLPKSDVDLSFKIDVTPGKSIVAAPAALTDWRSRSERLGFRSSSQPCRAAVVDLGPIKQVCRHFERGHCRHGPTCRYSHEVTGKGSSASHSSGRGAFGRGRGFITDNHDSSTNESLFRDVREIDHWLMNQLSLVAGENIEQLSGDKGLRALSHVVQRKHLPADTISLFVKLLVKDEIRTSLLRQKTNKIYGVLLGSPFLLQLHAHVASHLWNPTRPLKAQDVRPYLLLTEELQSRTADGWKEVPLDALQNVVSKLEESATKDELLAISNRLVDQRDKLQRLLAVAPPDKCLQGAKFRELSILPSKEELLRFQARQDLPVNHIGMQYTRVSDYLETHFQLLREDCIEPLRQGIKAYRSTVNNTNGYGQPSDSGMQELRIYSQVQLHGLRCGDKGVEHVLSFALHARDKDTQQWESSKKLMFGALLCISSDQFQTFFWGVVAKRDVKDLAKGLVAIRIMGESDANITSTDEYVMVESTAAYFEAYYHVLKTLQREGMEDIPFTKYLLSLEPRVSLPSYLLQRKSEDEYDFSCVNPDINRTIGKSSIRITQSEWPSGWADSLDRTQQDALKQGLTKELAIIQGPPGTGKTFLGLLLVKILLANLKTNPGSEPNWHTRRRAELEHGLMNELELHHTSGPIFIVCYSNHALDQFLEGIYRNGETNLVRIGGQSKSDMLKDKNLLSLLHKQVTDREVDRSYHRFSGQARFEKDRLESEIHKCIDVMGTKFVTFAMLDGVATPEQIESLFSIHLLRDRSSKRIVELWLNEAWCVDPFLAHHFFVNENQQGYESGGAAEPAVKPRRGGMKPLQNSETDEDGDWSIQVRRLRGPHRAPRDGPAERLQFVDNPEGHNGWGFDDGDAGPNPLLAPHVVAEVEEHGLLDFVDAPNVWQLNLGQRRKLHDYWLEEIRMNQRRKLRELTQEYGEACKNATEVDNEIQRFLLRKAKVVGMTTTAAARYHDVLKSLKPEIIIVEEAAEVLEAHILACLSPSVKHLILIGDHLQLRPSTAVHRLSIEHKLDVSMFERLVKSGVEHVTLQEQRRMRPSISKLVRSLYPRSRDHESVTHYEAVKGVKPDVFFFDHKAGEDNVRDAASKVNSCEAKLVVELCVYLLNQGCYRPQDIAILSMYSGQIIEIKTLLRQRSNNKWYKRAIGESTQDLEGEKTEIPRVSSVDDYQGEESDIIILSLVRSNTIVTDEGVGKIGFLRTSNRICVALTRARKGLFIFGNADLLAEKSSLWNEVTGSMRNDGQLGPELELYCENHPDTITRISTADDFKQVEDGGCSLPCEFQLECGHACPRRCHFGSHDLVVCPKPCLRQYDECSHSCNFRCHGSEDCPSCKKVVTKQMPSCEHQQRMECSTDVKDVVCLTDCPKNLQCGHQCRTLCGKPCIDLCKEKVVKLLPCGHSARISCHEDPETSSCGEPCVALLEDCQHQCQGSCGKCKQGTAHIPCQKKCGRTLPCGHLCEAGCSLNCPPCPKRCQKRCFHSRCSESCGHLCKPCREPCSWQCEHYKCDKSCHETCTRPRCDLPCAKVIPKCGHSCIGLCGEPCPTKCRVCHPETLDIITRMTLDEYEESEIFVQLDCGHVFQFSGLDTWMSDSYETAEHGDGSVAIKLKECPECRTPIWRTHRYSNVVKDKHAQVQDVKKRIWGYEKTRQGNLLLEQRDDIGALSAFRQALQENPGLMEAHFGTGCAFCLGREYAKAITHFSFIVERSLFSTTLSNLIKNSQGKGHIVGFVEKFYGSSSSRAGDSIAIKAVVQWAVALTKSRDFNGAVELCNAALGRDPENSLAQEVKEKAEKGEVELVVKVMAAEVGERGHWFKCPNGHPYCIGECGGAMQISKCPDCKAKVGGLRHSLLAGNSHSNIDGSDDSAWPGS